LPAASRVWKLRSDEHTESGNLTATARPDAVIEGIKSPFDFGGNRSIVTIHLKGREHIVRLHGDIYQSATIQRHLWVSFGSSRKKFQSFRKDPRSIMWVRFPWWTRLTLWFMEVPWLVGS